MKQSNIKEFEGRLAITFFANFLDSRLYDEAIKNITLDTKDNIYNRFEDAIMSIYWAGKYDWNKIYDAAGELYTEGEYKRLYAKDFIRNTPYEDPYPIGTILYRKSTSDKYNSSYSQIIKINRLTPLGAYGSSKGVYTKDYLDEHFTIEQEVTHQFRIGDKVQYIGTTFPEHIDVIGIVYRLPKTPKSNIEVKISSNTSLGCNPKDFILFTDTNLLINKNIKNETNDLSRDITQIKKREISRRSITASRRCIPIIDRSNRRNQERDHASQEKTYLTIKKREI